MIIKLIKVGLLILFSWLIASCDKAIDKPADGTRLNDMKTTYVIPSNCDFNTISRKFSSNECSPIIKDYDFVGLLINVPSIIYVDEELTIPLACTYAHDVNKALHLSKPLKNSIVFLAVNNETNEVYSGQMKDIENRLPSPGSVKNEREQSTGSHTVKKIVGGFVNAELIELLRLPKKAAKYTVYATVAEYKSNVMTVEVKEKD